MIVCGRRQPAEGSPPCTGLTGGAVTNLVTVLKSSLAASDGSALNACLANTDHPFNYRTTISQQLTHQCYKVLHTRTHAIVMTTVQ